MKPTKLIMIACLFATGCQTLEKLKFWENSGEAKEETSENPDQVFKPDNKELDLKLSKLWARLDELETEVLRQRELIHLLRKGVVTGIVPNELLNYTEDSSFEKKPKEVTLTPELPKEEVKDSEKAAEKPPEAPTEKAAAKKDKLSPEEEADYQDKLARAHSLFSGEHWGQAIAVYGEIGEQYDDAVTKGHHLYWIGVSWFNLKEYQLARKHLEEFINRYPQNSLLPKANLYLAKVEYQMGFLDKSLQRLKVIIRDYPNDEASKMAKWEINQIEQSL